MFANAHFRGADDPAFEPEQFLGIKVKPKKQHPAITQALLDHAMNKLPAWAEEMIAKQRGKQ